MYHSSTVIFLLGVRFIVCFLERQQQYSSSSNSSNSSSCSKYYYSLTTVVFLVSQNRWVRRIYFVSGSRPTSACAAAVCLCVCVCMCVCVCVCDPNRHHDSRTTLHFNRIQP
jgi:hypothetical protein